MEYPARNEKEKVNLVGRQFFHFVNTQYPARNEKEKVNLIDDSLNLGITYKSSDYHVPQRPRLQIPLTPADRIIEAAGWICLAALWAMTIIAYGNLPETIPTHFGVGGEADDYGGKMTLFILPGIGTISFIGLTVLNYYPHAFNYPVDITAENALTQYTNATRMMRYMKLSMMFIFSVLVFLIYKAAITGSESLGIWFLPVVIGIVVIPLGYFTFKAIKGI